MIQLTLTLKMTTTQVEETSVTDNNNSQDYVHPNDPIQPTINNNSENDEKFEQDLLLKPRWQ